MLLRNKKKVMEENVIIIRNYNLEESNGIDHSIPQSLI